MKPYRYSLGRLTAVCPQCHRRTFKLYVDNVTQRPLDSETGRCNREVKCGYHQTPSQFFAMNRVFGASRPVSRAMSPPVPRLKAFSTIDASVAVAGFSHLGDDNLYRFMCGLFSRESVDRVFGESRVGHARFMGNSTVFWLVDRDGVYRSGKVMAYDAVTGRRVKTGGKASISFAHALMGLKEFDYCACFFGEKMAAERADATIVVVESEKTALLVNLSLDEIGDSRYVAVASGGASAIGFDPMQIQFRQNRCNFMIGRDVILVPDADMVGQWKQRSEALARYARSVAVVDVTMPPFSLTGSQDIGDYIVGLRQSVVGVKNLEPV